MAYPISRWIVLPIYKLWLRKVNGLDNMPKGKPFIIAANHSSYFDIFIPAVLVIRRVNKDIRALVNSYYWNNFLTKYFLNIWQAIPVFVDKEKNSKQKNKLAFEKASDYLKKNDLVMIFPEGTRSNDGKLKKAYTGVARLALKSKAPVLPIGIIGAHKVLPKGKAFPRFVRCEVNIGKLIYFEKYYSKKTSKKMLEEVTRIIMKEIARLIKQEYNY